MAKKHKNICLVTTVYSFFLYLLIKGYNENDIFIFTGWFPKEVSKNVKHIQMPPVIFKGKKFAELNSISGFYKNIIGFIGYFYGYLKLRILLFIKTFNCDVEVYGHAQTPFSYIFFENTSNIIEDGVANYTAEICKTHKINPIIDAFLHICGIYYLNMCECYGSHENVKNVYLTNPNNHPLIKDKVKVVNVGEKWNKLTHNEKKVILNLFNLDFGEISFNKDIVLILTQPLYKDGFLTLDEELNIYKEFLDKFKDRTIIIKPHPRDKKDYEKIFPNVMCLNKEFPIELLDLINIRPQIVCSVISTALLNFEDSEIYVYQGELANEDLIKLREDLIILIKKKNKKLIT